MKRIKKYPIILFLICFSKLVFTQSYIPALEGITSEECLYHIKFLASDEMRGRETFTQEQYIAARYIANEFEKYGLKPGVTNDNYYQNFNMEYAIAGTENYLKIDGKTYTEGKDFTVPAVGNNTVKGEIVFVGYGISADNYDSYAGMNIKGKIVMVFEGKKSGPGPHFNIAPLHEIRILNAIKRGATGMIFVKGTSPKNHKMPIPPEGPIVERFSQVSEIAKKMGLSDFDNKCLEQVKMFPMVYVTLEVANEILESHSKTITDLKKEIDKTGKPHSFELKQKAELKTDISNKVRTTMNVIGFIEGSEINDESIIIGAHYDHIGVTKNGKEIYNGADDNASGTAALLEIAQAFSECERKPKRNVYFIAFTAEEKGVLGSGYYVKNPVIPLSKTKAMLNLDMIGRNSPDTIDVVIKDNMGNLLSLNKDISAEVGIYVKESDITPYTSTDHRHFLDENIPSVWYYDGGGEFAHKVFDTWDKILPKKVQNTARLCFICAYKTANR